MNLLKHSPICGTSPELAWLHSLNAARHGSGSQRLGGADDRDYQERRLYYPQDQDLPRSIKEELSRATPHIYQEPPRRLENITPYLRSCLTLLRVWIMVARGMRCAYDEPGGKRPRRHYSQETAYYLRCNLRTHFAKEKRLPWLSCKEEKLGIFLAGSVCRRRPRRNYPERDTACRCPASGRAMILSAPGTAGCGFVATGRVEAAPLQQRRVSYPAGL